MDWKDPNVAKQYKPGEAMTGPFALHILQQAGLDASMLPTTGDLVTLDNACGTGILTVHLYATLPDHAKARIQHTCSDISPAMIDAVQSRISDAGWQGASAKVLDAQKMDVPSNTFTHVLTNFGFVGARNPRLVLEEWRRILRPGGIAGFTVWEFVGWFPVVEAAVRMLDGPKFPTWKEFCTTFSSGGPWDERAFFEKEINAAGFEEVRIETHENKTRHANAKEFCDVYGGMCKVIMGNFWGGEEKEKYGPLLNSAIEKALKEQQGEGEVVLDWKAWVVTAKAPKEK